MNIVMALLGLGFLVFIHELGHFWAARATGVRVDEFAIGFGGAIFKHRHNGILYRINWLPIGGYVKMHGEDDPDAADAPDNFNNRPLGARILVICAGVIMNLIGTFVILTVLFNVYGSPTSKMLVDQVTTGSPAQAAGLKANDQIISANQIAVNGDFDTFNKQVQAHNKQPLPMEVIRDGKTVPLTVTPKVLKDNKVQIGVSLKMENVFVKQGNFSDNVGQAFRQTGTITAMTWNGLKQLVTGGVSFNDIGGPVEIIRVTGQASQTGAPHYLYVLALISVNLAVMNILPLPALDGGRLLFLLIEFVRRGKRVSVEREASINFIGILFLLMFMVVVTFKDVFHIFVP